LHCRIQAKLLLSTVKLIKSSQSNKYIFPQSQHKKPADIEALRQGLDPPERFEFDSQADRELHRLNAKTKHLVDDWMEHYRVALGMASPAIKRMLDKPKVCFRCHGIFNDF